MMTMRPERPKITPGTEVIGPDVTVPAAPVDPPVETSPLSVRLPATLTAEFQRIVRVLHAETGRSKGEISAALIRHALLHTDDVREELTSGG